MTLIDFECLDIDVQNDNFANILENGKMDLNSFLKQYKDCPEKQETINNIKNNINIRNIFQNAYIETNIMIKNTEL